MICLVTKKPDFIFIRYLSINFTIVFDNLKNIKINKSIPILMKTCTDFGAPRSIAYKVKYMGNVNGHPLVLKSYAYELSQRLEF